MRTANRIVALLTVILGIYATVGGIDLQIFAANGNPGPGFLPACLGGLLVLIGILIFLESFSAKTDKRPQPLDKAGSYDLVVVTVSSVAVMLLTPILGMVISIGLMAGGLAALMGERRVKVLAALVVVTPAFLYLLFGVGLGVPLPMGIFAA